MILLCLYTINAFVTGENWVSARRSSQSSLHVLNPLAVNVDVLQCMVDDAELPR